MRDSHKLSVMSSFIKGKIDDKGWSMKKFIEETGLSQSYAYKLVSDKRDFTPDEETLNKIADVMGFSEKDRSYVLDLAGREREIGLIIYSDEHVPYPPEPVPAPHPQPEPLEPQPGDVHPGPEHPPSPPGPHPQPPASVSDGVLEVPWSHKKVIIALFAGLLGGLLIGCCSASTVVPVIMNTIGY